MNETEIKRLALIYSAIAELKGMELRNQEVPNTFDANSFFMIAHRLQSLGTREHF